MSGRKKINQKLRFSPACSLPRLWGFPFVYAVGPGCQATEPGLRDTEPDFHENFPDFQETFPDF
jgi:hypothetical protein